MKFKKLLPIALLSAMMITACGGTGSKYGVEITNKDAIAAEGFYDTMSRELEIALTPEGNVMLEMTNGNLTVTSSDTSVVAVSGVVLTAMKEGTATVTVKYYDAIDTVEITTAGAKPAPEAIEATCAEVMAAEDTAGGYIYTGWGYLVDWGKKTGPNEYGELGLADSMDAEYGDDDYMYVYGSFVNPGEGKQGFKWSGTAFVKDYDRDFLTAELTQGLKLGDKIQFRCIRSDYGTTKEVIAQILDVEPAPIVAATSVTLDSTTLELASGTSAQLTATVEPANCNQAAVWSSSDVAVATVNDSGVVTAIAGGTATITVAYGDITATCSVTVIELPSNYVLVSSSTLGLGKTYTPDTPYTGTSKGVSFEAANLADYGDGMQWCKVGHDKYGAGSMWNTTAFAEEVTKIIFAPSATKSFYDNEDAFKVEIANNAEFTDAAVEYVSTVKGAPEVVYEPTAAGTFIRISVNITYTMYTGSVTFVAGEDAPATEEKVTLTADALGLAAYGNGEKEIGGYTVSYIELATYGDGIQMRSKNKTADTRSQFSIDFGTKKIAKIEFTYAATKTLKYDGENALEITYNGAATADETLSLVAGQFNYTITPANDATSVHIGHNLAYTYTMYWDSIVFYLA